MLDEVLIYVDYGDYYLSYSCPVLSCNRCKLRFLCYTTRDTIGTIGKVVVSVDKYNFSRQQHFRPRYCPTYRIPKLNY